MKKDDPKHHQIMTFFDKEEETKEDFNNDIFTISE
jgi:hypothetical protein